MSFAITLNSSTVAGADPGNFEVKYREGVPLPVNESEYWEVALVNMALWYSWHNISSEFGNNTLRYSADGGITWKQVVFPNGIYQIEEIESEFHRQMEANGDFDPTDPYVPRYYIHMVPIWSTLKLLTQVSNNYQVDYSNNGTSTLYQLLGHPNTVISADTEGPSIVDITRGVDALNVKCSLINGSYDNEQGSNILYSFNPRSKPGNLINIEPINPMFLPVDYNGKFYSIRMQLVDQLGRSVNLNGEDVVYRLYFRKVKK